MQVVNLILEESSYTFHINSAGSYYTEDEAKEMEKLGFNFEETKLGSVGSQDNFHKLCEGDIKEFGSLKELMDFIDEWGNIVISPPQTVGGFPTLEIYDDYRE